MKAPNFSYFKPATLVDAIKFKSSDKNSVYLAGGQSLMPALNMRLSTPSCLIDINKLEELKLKINLFFHDSEHVLQTILSEINLVNKILDNNAYVCIDDANYKFKKINTGYSNIIRKKLGLTKSQIRKFK